MNSTIALIIAAISRRPRGVVMIWMTIAVLGGVAVNRMPISRLPQLDIPIARIIAEFPALSAEEMETLIAAPLENALLSVAGAESSAAFTKEGLAAVDLYFGWENDMRRAAVEIRGVIDDIHGSLPHGIRKPVIFIRNLAEQPSALLAIRPGEGESVAAISNIVTNDITDQLRQIPGVGAIRIVGARQPEIAVEVAADRLLTTGVSIANVVSSIAVAITEQPVGTIIHQGRERLVKFTAGIAALEQIADIRLQPAAAARSVSDVATVSWDYDEPTSLFQVDGVEAIGLFIYSGNRRESNRHFANRLRSTISQINRRYDQRIAIEPLTVASDEVRLSLINLLISLFLGLLAIIIVLPLLLRSARSALIIAASIPTSVLGALLIIYLTDLGLNTTSLTGLALGIGMIVDNSIVVVEYLSRGGTCRSTIIGRRTAEMVVPLTASTVTTLLVFLPLLFIPGASGVLFKELSLTIIYLLLLSLLVACSLTPALFRLAYIRKIARSGKSVPPTTQSFFPSARSLPGGRLKRQRWASRLSNGYGHLLAASLQRPTGVLLLLALLIAVGALTGHLLPKRIIPRERPRWVVVEIDLAGEPSFSAINQTLSAAAERLQQIPQVKQTIVEGGYHWESIEERAQRRRSTQTVTMRIELAPGYDEQMMTAVAQQLHDIAFSSLLLLRPTSNVEELLGNSDVVEYRIGGNDRQRLLEAAHELERRIATDTPDVTVTIDTRRDRPQWLLLPRSAMMAHHSLNARTVVTHLRSAINGTIATSLRWQGEEIAIRVRLQRAHHRDIASLSQLRLLIDEQPVRIDSIVDIEHRYGYRELHRRNRQPAVTMRVSAPPEQRSRIVNLLQNHRFSREGISGELVGQRALREQLNSLGGLLLIATLLIYLTLGAQMESLQLPLLIMAMLLPALAGALLLLFVGGKSINLNSGLGMLLLIGVCVNTAILLLNAYRKTGGSREELIAQSRHRLRAIAATVATTLIALTPIALLEYGYTNPQADMALAVMGGLIAGVGATLFLIPLLYRWWGRRRN